MLLNVLISGDTVSFMTCHKAIALLCTIRLENTALFLLLFCVVVSGYSCISVM